MAYISIAAFHRDVRNLAGSPRSLPRPAPAYTSIPLHPKHLAASAGLSPLPQPTLHLGTGDLQTQTTGPCVAQVCGREGMLSRRLLLPSESHKIPLNQREPPEQWMWPWELLALPCHHLRGFFFQV